MHETQNSSIYSSVKNTNPNSLISANFKCGPDNVNCVDQENLGWIGWLLFYLLTFLYLGTDIVNAILQIRKSIANSYDLRLFINGFLLLGLTILSLTSSLQFNLATAASNTDLIINTVVLLFINDLYEQTMAVVDKMFPSWNEERVDEIKKYLKMNDKDIDVKCPDVENSNESLSSRDEQHIPSRSDSFCSHTLVAGALGVEIRDLHFLEASK